MPVICKLADFAERWSEIAQTKTLLANKIKPVERGTRSFMALEVSVDTS